MARHYIRDGLNPRGAEYGAAARAAEAAQRNAEAANDLLELQLASSPEERARVAAGITARRQRQASIKRVWDKIQLIFVFFVIAGVVWLFTDHGYGAPQSAVTHDAPAHVSQAPRVSHAPAIPVAAPNAAGSPDVAYTVAAAGASLRTDAFNNPRYRVAIAESVLAAADAQQQRLTPCEQFDVMIARAVMHSAFDPEHPDQVSASDADRAGLPDAENCNL